MIFYSVYKGFKPGIYTNADDVDIQVKNFTNPVFKKCNTIDEARYFLNNGKTIDSRKYTIQNKICYVKKIHTSQSNILQFFGSNSNDIYNQEDTHINDDIDNLVDTKVDNDNKNILGVNNTIIIYTDGSCMKRHKNIAGCGVHFPNNEYTDISEKFLHTPITNQRAELYAILLAIRTVTENNTYRNASIIIHSDSEYSINCITKWCKGWEKNKWRRADNSELKNLDIIIPIYELYNKHTIQLIHVRAHCGILGNEIADTLATDAAKR